MKRTLLLNPPSFQDFDGGAGSRYQATREVISFWYPTWLCYPAGLIPESRVVDAPPENLTVDQVAGQARDFDLAVLFTSSASFTHDLATVSRLKEENPGLVAGLVGWNNAGHIHRSAATCQVTGQRQVGTIVAQNCRGRISGCSTSERTTSKEDLVPLIGYEVSDSWGARLVAMSKKKGPPGDGKTARPGLRVKKWY